MENNPFDTNIVSRRKTLQVLGAGIMAPSVLVACTESGGGGAEKTSATEKKDEMKAAGKKPSSQPDDKKEPEGEASKEKAAAADGEGEKMAKAGDVECDTSGIDQQSKQMRKTLQYVAKTPNEGKYCSNCAQWKPPEKKGTCGGCKLFSGPVNPNGYCLSYAPMKAS